MFDFDMGGRGGRGVVGRGETFHTRNEKPLIPEDANNSVITSILSVHLATQKGVESHNKGTPLCLDIDFILSITHLSELQ